MNPEERFGKGWFPQVLSEETIAEGIWWYDGEIPYSVQLKHMRLNYTADDLTNFYMFIHELDVAHPVEVSVEGDAYMWVFEGPNGRVPSPCFDSLEKAKDYIAQFGGNVEINWATK